jgi:UDP-N-acetylmuramate dehydrogenase
MMALNRPDPHLVDRLPVVRGSYSIEAPLSKYTWFRTGGPADVVYRPKDAEDLAEFLRARPADIPVTVLGVGSNVLVRDGGIRGVVIRLGSAFAEIAIRDDEVSAGAGAQDLSVANACRDSGLAGLEFLSGIPGMIGGALRMNAGAYGREMRDVVVAVEALDEAGRLHRLSNEAMGFVYRACGVSKEWIFLRAVLRGEAGDPAAIAGRIAEIRAARESTQPTRGRTGGSTFKNPPGEKAWALIERAGCRGMRRGDAMVSEKHCNFLINTGSATACDIERLGEEVRRRVRAESGIDLEWEIQRIGEARPGRSPEPGAAR